ncbi:MAG: MDR/zinc-dependent alcohol dehydrogenase-like family protein [Myxococcaceae bacterium]
MKMRAAVLAGPGRVELDEVQAPDPGKGQVRVRLEGSGVCGSDLPPFEGRSWFTYPFAPGAPGHEGWGVIEAVGREVGGFPEGMRVAALSGRAFAEYDVVEPNRLVRLPSELDGRAFPGEALGCAVNVFRRAGIRSGTTLAVVGIGFIGAVVTALAVSAGARVFAISRRAFARRLADDLGANYSLPFDRALALEQVRDLTAGRLCDVVVEAVGHQSALDLASELVRVRGRLVIAGYHQDGERRVNMEQWNWRGLDVVNAHERAPAAYLDGMAAAIDAISSGQLVPWPLLTHSFPLGELGRAFETLRTRPEGFLKAVVTTS